MNEFYCIKTAAAFHYVFSNLVIGTDISLIRKEHFCVTVSLARATNHIYFVSISLSSLATSLFINFTNVLTFVQFRTEV